MIYNSIISVNVSKVFVTHDLYVLSTVTTFKVVSLVCKFLVNMNSARFRIDCVSRLVGLYMHHNWCRNSQKTRHHCKKV